MRGDCAAEGVTHAGVLRRGLNSTDMSIPCDDAATPLSSCYANIAVEGSSAILIPGIYTFLHLLSPSVAESERA